MPQIGAKEMIVFDIVVVATFRLNYAVVLGDLSSADVSMGA